MSRSLVELLSELLTNGATYTLKLLPTCFPNAKSIVQDLRIRQDHQVPSQGPDRYSTFHRSSLAPHERLDTSPVTSCNSVEMVNQLPCHLPGAHGIQPALLMWAWGVPQAQHLFHVLQGIVAINNVSPSHVGGTPSSPSSPAPDSPSPTSVTSQTTPTSPGDPNTGGSPGNAAGTNGAAESPALTTPPASPGVAPESSAVSTPASPADAADATLSTSPAETPLSTSPALADSSSSMPASPAVPGRPAQLPQQPGGPPQLGQPGPQRGRGFTRIWYHRLMAHNKRACVRAGNIPEPLQAHVRWETQNIKVINMNMIEDNKNVAKLITAHTQVCHLMHRLVTVQQAAL